MLKSFIFFSLSVFLFAFSCAVDITENGTDYLTPPVIIGSEIDGKNIIIKFYGYNNEYYFDGYNVYASNIDLNRTGIAAYKPVEVVGINSAEPSFPLSPDDYNQNKIREITIDYYNWRIDDTNEDVKFPFTEGSTYYILLCSHHKIKGVTEYAVSNKLTVEFKK